MPHAPDSTRPDALPPRPEPGSPTFWPDFLAAKIADRADAQVIEAELLRVAISGDHPGSQLLADALALVRVLLSRLGQDIDEARAWAAMADRLDAGVVR
jgi:hypothetical protein